ncbi:MAG: discoidin domain-containing protein [Ignavibacteriaceae bacterium]
MFNGVRRRFWQRTTTSETPDDIYQYKIETSLDGETYETALDQTKNNISRNTIFEEIPPVKCRFVRLTITNYPKFTPLGIIEFTVFGKSAEALPAKVPIPVTN